MKEYKPFSDKANDALLAKKIEIGLHEVEQNLLHAYEEEMSFKECCQGEEGAEEDEDSDVEVRQPKSKKGMKVVITDEEQHAEAAYEVKLQKRRLFDAIVKPGMTPIQKLKVFTALID